MTRIDWYTEFCDKTVHLCGLCANSGIIDMTGGLRSKGGAITRGVYFCVCPNGRTIKRKAKCKPEEVVRL